MNQSKSYGVGDDRNPLQNSRSFTFFFPNKIEDENQ